MTATRNLAVRLAEVDHALREIQAELVPGRAPALLEPVAEPREREGPLAEVLAHAPRTPEQPDHDTPVDEQHVILLASIQEVLAGLERALAQLRDPEVSVSAGPFSTTESVRAFERALATLPGVRGVEVRGYEGADRAVIDVQLERPNT